RRFDEALAKPDPELAGEDADDAPGGPRVGPGEEAGEQVGLARRTGGGLDRGERGSDLDERRRARRVRLVARPREHVADRRADVGEAVVRPGELGAAGAADLAEGIR